MNECKKNLQMLRRKPLFFGEGKTESIYTVSMNYNQRLEEMVKAGNYYSVDSKIHPYDFPVSRHENRKLEIHLVRVIPFFGHLASSEVVLEVLDRMKLRPAELPELLALGAQYPDLQRGFDSIVTLGSIYRDPHGDLWAPELCNQNLDVSPAEISWGPYDVHLFSAVPK